MLMKILVGSDPEVFVRHGGKHVSAHGLIPGTKEEPFPVQDGAVQVDGMALEFNINPARSEDEFVHNLDSVMAQLRDMVPDHSLSPVPVARFTREYMDAQPEEAKELGCDPDFNAWMHGMENRKPDADVAYRTGAGHIHVGLWSPDDQPENAMDVAICCVKQMDYYLGLPSLMYDGNTQRRKLYGAAGAFRLKPYGFEYRVLSNVWLRSEALKR